MPLRCLSPWAALAIVAGPAAAATPLPPPLATFLDQHCIECHDADMKKGGLDLDALKFDLTDANAFKQWQHVFGRVRDGEMPPAKKEQPAKADAEAFLAGLQEPLLKADAADIAANGRVRSRRLTRTEYEHTMHDLLGIDIPLKELLPEDRASHGFETVAEGQQLSHHQLGRYLDVADQALDEAFDRAFGKEKPFQMHVTPEQQGMFTTGNFRGPNFRDGKCIAWPFGLQFVGRMKATTVPDDGWYRITLRGVHGINPGKDGAVWGTLRSGTGQSSAPMLYMIGLIEATATPRDLVYEGWIQRHHLLELKPNDGTLRRAPTGAKGGNVSYKGRDLAKEGFSGIANTGIDIERIHLNGDRADVWRRLFGETSLKKAPEEVLEKLVTRFATRAFRRPATPEQAAPYVEMARKVIADGKALPDALRTAYRAILCSPRFLTFIEAPGELDDHAIASRLSYAFWVSMPDAQLSKLAAAGRLHEPAVLTQEMDRMLADPKAKRFINSFTDQWLKLNQIDFTNPDTRQFSTFDPVLQESMLQETRAYFTEVLQNNLGITHLVDSDFAFLNGRLLRHYLGDNQTSKPAEKKKPKKDKDKEKTAPEPPPAAWIEKLISAPLVPGEGVQKTKLQPSTSRGGLVTQGAVLKVTADGTSTSPVVRGVFINERILGEHIPPPPPGIPAIEPDIRGATSIRDQLAKHRSNESCASCHNTIDPPGFALELFDPVGGWRTRYGKGDKGAKVDPSGLTPEGDAFADLAAWQKLYTKRPEQLARGFASQFLTYATGAPPRFSNETALGKIIAMSGKTGFGLRSIIREAVLSPVFLAK
ncbi:MAG: DUF1592 domain-containing protein [Prosthecobacter sp.]